MSHFAVTVRVPARTKPLLPAIEREAEKILAPYNEQDDNYSEFVDTEDESREKYETDGTEYVKMPDGELVLPWNEKFRKEGSFTKEPPPELPKIFIPFKEKFATFEDYMREWEGSDGRSEEDGRYGHFSNPNAKWDYWRIGGRWRGHLYLRPTAPGFVPPQGGLAEAGYEYGPDHHKGPVPGSATEVDYCRIQDLDFERASREAQRRVDALWEELPLLLAGKKYPLFEGPRSTLLDVGILDCLDAHELKGNEFWKEKWDNGDRYDVIAVEPVREKYEQLLLTRLNPMSTFAFVDENGWHEKGEMGWFGCSSATPESAANHLTRYWDWLREGDQRDWVVVVDCHT